MAESNFWGRDDILFFFASVRHDNLDVAVAFRASFYLTELSRTKSDLAVDFNRQFPSKYHVIATPFAVHCLFLAIKIETRILERLAVDRLVFAPHFRMLEKNVCGDVRAFINRTECEMCAALNWQLLPPCPFTTLSVLEENALLDERVKRSASKLCKQATIRRYEMDGKLMAYAAVVAAETATTSSAGCDVEVVRLVKTLTLLAALNDEGAQPAPHAILEYAQRLESLIGHALEHTPNRKRQRSSIPDTSPTSIIDNERGDR
jgi:hypothetical protein